MNVESQEEIQKFKAELWNDADEEFDIASSSERIVAEGDSWFDYLPGKDILDYLKKNHSYKIKKFSDGGDTLENMVYGTEYRRNWNRRTPQIHETLDALKKYRPKVFLFSGGGNDLAGSELDSYFNHNDSSLPNLREDYIQYMFFTVFKKAYIDLIHKVHSIDSNIHIISHGYGHGKPDGSSVKYFGFSFAGPWLRPTFTRKNILSFTERKRLIAYVLDQFNKMLNEVDNENPNFHYIDLRPHLSEKDWVNELHLHNVHFERIAQLFNNEIQKYIL